MSPEPLRVPRAQCFGVTKKASPPSRTFGLLRTETSLAPVRAKPVDPLELSSSAKDARGPGSRGGSLTPSNALSPCMAAARLRQGRGVGVGGPDDSHHGHVLHAEREQLSR